VVEVLSELDKESVYVVSHEEDLKAWFPSTMCISKKNGFSRVEEY
jgi:DNA repair exonuclease SbcCD ATPase subunit